MNSGLLIDGSSLGIILNNESLRNSFLILSEKYTSVVVCRATPK